MLPRNDDPALGEIARQLRRLPNRRIQDRRHDALDDICAAQLLSRTENCSRPSESRFGEPHRYLVATCSFDVAMRRVAKRELWFGRMD